MLHLIIRYIASLSYTLLIQRSFTYYVITKREGGGFRNDYTNVIFALSNAEFYYGRGGLKTDKK